MKRVQGREARLPTRSMTEEIVVQRHTMASEGLSADVQDETIGQIQAAQQLTYEQLKSFWDEHQTLRQATGSAFAESTTRQEQLHAELMKQRDEMAAHARQLEEAARIIQEQQEALRQASAVVGRQGSELKEVKEAIWSPRGKTRWGLFAGPAEVPGRTNGEPEGMAALLGGGGIPAPPVYKGCTKKEKREFMDRYLTYQRRIQSLGECTGRNIVLMPVSTCIENKTLVRICLFELKKPAEAVTEDEWRQYFLEARQPNAVDFSAVESALKTLKVDVSVKDARSRVMKLVSAFQERLEAQDMEGFLFDEQKMCVRLLAGALEPVPFRVAIRKELKMEVHRSVRSDLQKFIDWVIPRMEAFLMFESSLPKDAGEKKPKATEPPKDGAKGPWVRKRKPLKAAGAVAEEDESAVAAVGADIRKNAELKKVKKNRCFKCGSEEHGVFRCPQCNEEEARALWAQNRDAHPGESSRHVGSVSADRERALPASVGGHPVRVTLDTGADQSIVSLEAVVRLTDAGCDVKRRRLGTPRALKSFSNETVSVEEEVTLDVTVPTECGQMLLKNVNCWVSPHPLPASLGDCLLSRHVMRELGFDEKELLAKACQQAEERDMGAVVDLRTLEEGQLEELEGARLLPDLTMDSGEEEMEIRRLLRVKAQEAQQAGADTDWVKRLEDLLQEHWDVFRLVLGRDPPVKTEPLRVRLKSGGRPVKSRARRYPAEHREFMRKHVEALVKAGLVYRNPRSRWSSPPLIVKKSGGGFRMTVDVRAVNSQTEATQWPMPLLEVVLDHVQGATVFFGLDFFKGYWQLPLHPSCQEMFSFLTDLGVYTPTRVLMGGSDSVAYCQAAVQEIFQDLLYRGLLAWLDDLLGYAEDAERLLELLEEVLNTCQRTGLKLNPSKCEFFKRSVKWCGRIIDAQGVAHDPERIRALTEMPDPETAQDLQQFLCAANWMRASIPAYNVIVSPLMELLERAYAAAGGRTRQKVARVELSDIGWGLEHAAALQRCKDALTKAVRLAHLDPAQELCVFTDASEKHWGAVVTQIPAEDSGRPLEDQAHQPLMFLSGAFTGAAGRWPIIEKEAFALVETVKRADYMLHRSGGFQLFTDHKNLRYIFNPASVISKVPKYTADKLQRWSLLLMGYDYRIVHLPGEKNVWADLLSRWGTSEPSICALKLVQFWPSAQLDDRFQWPGRAELLKIQLASGEKFQFRDEDGLGKTEAGQWWVPLGGSDDFRRRICVVAHAGAAGHCGIRTTLDAIRRVFWWPKMEDEVADFVKSCLQCLCTRGGRLEPRPLGESIHATKPGEVLHMDFLYMGPSEEGSKYLLLLKDDAGKYLMLVNCARAGSTEAAQGLLTWFAFFGIVRVWVSDQGSHFKNEVIKDVQHVLGAQHHFVTALCPWANGTVEAANRAVLRVFRALLSEWKMPMTAWPRLTLLVQMVLNNTPVDSLGGEAPITAMTGRKPMGQLDPLMWSVDAEATSLDEVLRLQGQAVQELQRKLEDLHRPVAEAAERHRRRGKKRREPLPNFEVGDFVLKATVADAGRSKLQVVWKGPMRVVRAKSPWVFDVEDLITKSVSEAHVSRLRFYADKMLDVTEDLLSQAAHSQEGHEVEKFLGVRHDAAKAQFEVQIKWRGLEDSENSWEPADQVAKDVPVLLKKFLKLRVKDKVAKGLMKQLKWK